MSYPAILHVNNGKNDKEFKCELNDTDFIIFDITLNNLLNQCNISDNSNYDYFTYIDEDDELIDVKSDLDLQLFEEFCRSPNHPIHIYLKSSRPQYDSTTDDEDEGCSYFLKMSDLEHTTEIGYGQFGSVEKGYYPIKDEWIAIKRINAGEKRLEDEISTLRQCRDCSKIIKYLGASKEEGIVYLFLEYMDGKSLEKYGQIPLNVLGFINNELVDALTYIWKKKIWHRDLKPSNFLVNSKGQIKLADFGVSRALIFSNARTAVGTAAYIAPEVMRSPSYTVAADVWSYGVSVAEMAIGEPLVNLLKVRDSFQAADSIAESTPIIMEKLIEIDDSLLLEEFVHGCLKEDPNERLESLKLKDTAFVKRYLPVEYSVIAEFVKQFDFYTK